MVYDLGKYVQKRMLIQIVEFSIAGNFKMPSVSRPRHHRRRRRRHHHRRHCQHCKNSSVYVHIPKVQCKGAWQLPCNNINVWIKNSKLL